LNKIKTNSEEQRLRFQKEWTTSNTLYDEHCNEEQRLFIGCPDKQKDAHSYSNLTAYQSFICSTSAAQKNTGEKTYKATTCRNITKQRVARSLLRFSILTVLSS
jgi:hypothetical protein